jgi:uncharacterized protein (TIRG00374 family)
VPFLVAVAAIAALVLSVQPAKLAHAIARFDPLYIPGIVALSLAYYALQGLRWHVLLRVEGVKISRGETLLLNMAGQSTGLLPLGELSRAVFVAEATGRALGRVTATITVQELMYSSILIAVAIPGALAVPAAGAGVLVAFLGTVTVILILTVESIFKRVRDGVTHVPLLRRFLPAIDELQRDTVDLLRRRPTYTTVWISALQAGIAITLFWLSARGLDPGALTWHTAAFVYAVIHVASALTFSPGGLGAFELGTAGLLVAVGLPYSVGAATAIVHRAADKGLGTVVGMGCYAVARRRWHFGRITLLGLRQDRAGRSGRSGAARSHR